MRRHVRRAYLLRSMEHRFNPATQNSTDMRNWIDEVVPLFPKVSGSAIHVRQHFDVDGYVTVSVEQVPHHSGTDIALKTS